jgi:hypothetical protein
MRIPKLAHLQVGQRVAALVAGATLRTIERLRPAGGATLAAASARPRFARRRITVDDLAIAERLLAVGARVPAAELRRAAGIGADGPFTWVVGQPLPDGVLLAYARECQMLAALPEQMETEVQALRVGGCAVVALPGEIYCGLGLAIKAQTPEGVAPTLVASLANDYVGYVATRGAIEEEGGYETWAARSALPAAGTGEAMVEVAVGLVEQVANRAHRGTHTQR